MSLCGPTPISFSCATSSLSLAESSSVTWSARSARRLRAACSVVVGAVLRPLAGGRGEGLVAGEERLQQGVGEQAPVGARARGRAGSASQTLVSSAKTFSSAWDAGQRIGCRRAALPPLPADLVGDLAADLGAADVEVLDVLGLVVPCRPRSRPGRASRSARRTTRASPLCGVALASSSASVRLARRLARRLRRFRCPSRSGCATRR